MKIAVLSRNTRLYSTQRLVEVARERGHVVRVLDPLRCYVRISPGEVEIRYKGKALHDIDAAIPRIGTSSTFYGTAVLRQLEMIEIEGRLVLRHLQRALLNEVIAGGDVRADRLLRRLLGLRGGLGRGWLGHHDRLFLVVTGGEAEQD